MIVVHHLNNSRSQRILWMLEELGLPYEVKRYMRDEKTNLAPESLKLVHPLGKSPVITHGAQTMAESGAIISYLGMTFGKGTLFPEADTPAFWGVNYWLHYAEGSLMPFLVMKLVFDKIKSAPMLFFLKPIAWAIADKAMSSYIGPSLKTNLNFIEAHLGQNDWFVGNEFSAADIQMSFPLEAASTRVGFSQEYPHIKAFVAKIHARPAYQRALKVGGPYDYA